jgi:hypothetical protein
MVFDHEILQTREMIATAVKFKYPALKFVSAGIPVEGVSGDKVEWDIEEPNNEIDKGFVHQSSQSQPTQFTKVGHRVANALTTFVHKPIDGGKLLNLRVPGTKERNARRLIAREQDAMVRAYGARRDEWMIASMLKGTLTFTLEGVAQTIDYGIGATHKPDKSAGGDNEPWSTTTTDILNHVTDWKELIVADSGQEPTTMWLNSQTAMYLVENDLLQTYFASTAAGVLMVREGAIQRLFGLNIVIYDGAYYDGGSTKFIPDNYVMMTPDFDAEWISMVHGSNLIPFGDDLEEVEGIAMYQESIKDPIGIKMYLKYTRLPILKVPNAVIYALVA